MQATSNAPGLNEGSTLPVWTWVGNSISLRPSFLIYKVGRILLATEQGCKNNKCIKLYNPKLKTWLILLLLINYSPPTPLHLNKAAAQALLKRRTMLWEKRNLKILFL